MALPPSSSTNLTSRNKSTASSSSSKNKSQPTPDAPATTNANNAFPLAGTIGVAGGDGLNHGSSAGGGARRTLPEIVVTYRLPLVEDVQKAKQKAKPKSHQGDDGAPQPDQSLILLQSLRQSRLMHLTAMLPPFSQRVRNGMVYPGTCSIPNLDPKQPHVLIQLGRADVRIGPHVFPRTKFWEARQDKPVGVGVGVGVGGITTTPMPATASSSASSSPLKQVSQPVSVAAPPRPPPPRPTAPRPPAPQPSTSMSTSSPAPRPSVPSRPGTPARPPTAAPQVDEALVIRVNQKAAVEPQLRQLLHLAATGSASPQQLRALGGWIQIVTEELKREGTTLHSPSMVQAGLGTPKGPGGSGASGSRPPPTSSSGVARPSTSTPASTSASTTPTSTTPRGSAPGTPRPAQVPLARPTSAVSTRPSLGGATVSTPSSTSIPTPPISRPTPAKPASPTAALGTPTLTTAPTMPTPPALTQGPPPILVVEFRENPSMRFLLPLWRGAAVERKASKSANATATVRGGIVGGAGGGGGGPDAEVILTFMLPALGSEAGGGKEENGDKATATDLKGQKFERFPATWRISNVVSESMWEAFGRCPVVGTSFKGEEKGGEERARKEEEEKRKRLAESFVEMLKAMPKLGQLCYDAPSHSLPAGLQDHLSDKFLPKAIRLTSRPSVKRKGGETSDLLDANSSSNPKGSQGGAGIGNGEKKPKRQRHVATHNKDGTLKRCEACGTNSTPLWRRGPRGPSTLCNACGGRYKAGRLVLPAVPPTAPIETDKDQSSASANATTNATAITNLEPSTSTIEANSGNTEASKTMHQATQPSATVPSAGSSTAPASEAKMNDEGDAAKS